MHWSPVQIDARLCCDLLGTFILGHKTLWDDPVFLCVPPAAPTACAIPLGRVSSADRCTHGLKLQLLGEFQNTGGDFWTLDMLSTEKPKLQ